MQKFRELLQKFKDLLRQLLPGWLVRPIAHVYRRTRALLATLVFGFPGKSRLKIIGVTGTNGKTTTASFLASILRADGNKVAVSTTAYFQIADKRWPNKTNLTADYTFQLQRFLAKARRAKCDYVVLEVTAHGLEQRRGIWGINYQAVVMTNLTRDHLDYFKTMQRYAEAKSRLFESKPKIMVLNRDDEWFDFFNKFDASLHKLAYGTDKHSDAVISIDKLHANGSDFRLVIDKMTKLKFSIKLAGKFNVYNAAAAITAAYGLHCRRRALVKGTQQLDLVPGRMEYIDEGQSFNVVVDYAHTPDALANVLEALGKITKERLILVFGATGNRDKAKRPLMGKVAAAGANRIFVTDEEPYSERPKAIRAGILRGIEKAKAMARTKEVPGRDKAIEAAFKIAKPGDTVLIAGMGHQSYMVTAQGKIKWDDRQVARRLLNKRKL